MSEWLGLSSPLGGLFQTLCHSHVGGVLVHAPPDLVVERRDPDAALCLLEEGIDAPGGIPVDLGLPLLPVLASRSGPVGQAGDFVVSLYQALDLSAESLRRDFVQQPLFLVHHQHRVHG